MNIYTSWISRARIRIFAHTPAQHSLICFLFRSLVLYGNHHHMKGNNRNDSGGSEKGKKNSAFNFVVPNKEHHHTAITASHTNTHRQTEREIDDEVLANTCIVFYSCLRIYTHTQPQFFPISTSYRSVWICCRCNSYWSLSFSHNHYAIHIQ